MLVVAILAVLCTVFILPEFGRPRHASRANCQNNLKQIGLAYRTWEGDYGDRYPQALTGTREFPNGTSGTCFLPDLWAPTTGLSSRGAPLTSISQPWMVYRVMQNELNNPKIIICPADDSHTITPNADFTGTPAAPFNNSNCSYFVGRDADETYPAMMLSGDRNMCLSSNQANLPNGAYGYSPASGPLGWIVALGTNARPGWTAKMHKGAGNVGLADGSVQQTSSASLQRLVSRNGDTNSASSGQNWLLFP